MMAIPHAFGAYRLDYHLISLPLLVKRGSVTYLVPDGYIIKIVTDNLDSLGRRKPHRIVSLNGSARVC